MALDQIRVGRGGFGRRRKTRAVNSVDPTVLALMAMNNMLDMGESDREFGLLSRQLDQQQQQFTASQQLTERSWLHASDEAAEAHSRQLAALGVSHQNALDIIMKTRAEDRLDDAATRRHEKEQAGLARTHERGIIDEQIRSGDERLFASIAESRDARNQQFGLVANQNAVGNAIGLLNLSTNRGEAALNRLGEQAGRARQDASERHQEALDTGSVLAETKSTKAAELAEAMNSLTAGDPERLRNSEAMAGLLAELEGTISGSKYSDRAYASPDGTPIPMSPQNKMTPPTERHPQGVPANWRYGPPSGQPTDQGALIAASTALQSLSSRMDANERSQILPDWFTGRFGAEVMADRARGLMRRPSVRDVRSDIDKLYATPASAVGRHAAAPILDQRAALANQLGAGAQSEVDALAELVRQGPGGVRAAPPGAAPPNSSLNPMVFQSDAAATPAPMTEFIQAMPDEEAQWAALMGGGALGGY